jgi:hypothetical protein
MIADNEPDGVTSSLTDLGRMSLAELAAHGHEADVRDLRRIIPQEPSTSPRRTACNSSI